MTTHDLDIDATYPMGDGAWTAVVLSGVMLGLALASFWLRAIDPSGTDPMMDVVAWLLVVLGVPFLALGGVQLARRPLAVVFTASSVRLPAIPAWKRPAEVSYAEITQVGHVLVANVGECLVVQLRDGRDLRLPLKWLPGHAQVAERLEARRLAAAAGDPPWTFPAWERTLFDEQFAWLATPNTPPEPIDSWEVWDARMADDPPETCMLVTGRPAPSEALGIPADDVDRLLDQVLEAAREAGFEGRLERRNLGFVCASEDLVMELFALLRRVVALPPEAHTPALKQHFLDLNAARRESGVLLERAEDLDAVRDALVVELHAVDRVGGHGVVRPLGGGVVAVLALDHEHGVSWVPSDLAQRWGVSLEILFDQAITNLRAMPEPEPSDGDLFRIHSGPLAASQLLCLDRILETPNGAVVALPHQDELCVMDSILGLVMGGPMAMFAEWSHGQGHRPISPNLYIWWEGSLHPIAVRRAPDGKLNLVPPPDVFGEALAALRSSD